MKRFFRNQEIFKTPTSLHLEPPTYQETPLPHLSCQFSLNIYPTWHGRLWTRIWLSILSIKILWENIDELSIKLITFLKIVDFGSVAKSKNGWTWDIVPTGRVGVWPISNMSQPLFWLFYFSKDEPKCPVTCNKLYIFCNMPPTPSTQTHQLHLKA